MSDPGRPIDLKAELDAALAVGEITRQEYEEEIGLLLALTSMGFTRIASEPVSRQ